MPTKTDNLDLVWGVQAIADIIDRSYQATYHMINSGHLPIVRQIGERYVVSRSKLIAFFLEDAA